MNFFVVATPQLYEHMPAGTVARLPVLPSDFDIRFFGTRAFPFMFLLPCALDSPF